MPQTFDGQSFIRPQVVSRIDDSRLVGPNQSSAISLAILGIGLGGQPNTALEFTSARDARRTLRGGELLTAVERAYGPGANLQGAYRILAVRVNPATQSTLNLVDASAGQAIVLTSVDWGSHTAQIGVKIEEASINVPTPTIATAKKITVFKQGTASTPYTEVVRDNVNRPALTVLYTGAGTTCTLTIVPGTSVATTSDVTGDQISLNLTLPQYSTLAAVRDAFNTFGGGGKYTCSVAGPNELASSATIDSVTAQTIKTVAYTTRADLAAQLDFFNSEAADLVVATKGSAGTKPAAQLTTPLFLSGGGEGSTTNTNWQSALDTLASEDVQIVVPVTGDATLHAMVNTHCQTLSSSQYKRERVAIVGGVAGENVTQAKNRATALSSDRVQLVYPGLTDYATDNSGALVTVPPYLVAAQKAGINAALGYANSATHSTLGGRGVELVATPSQLDDLTYYGTCAIEKVNNRGFQIVQDITTWQTDQKFTRRELSTRMAIDFVARTLRDTLDTYIGQTNGPGLSAAIQADMVTALNQLTAQGILVGGASTPSYSGLTVSAVGDRVEVSLQVSVAVPANFFFITIYPTVFSSPLPEAR